MKLLGKYILSPKADLFAFTTFIPVYLLYWIFFEANILSFTLPDQPPHWFFLMGWILVDGSHVYSTLLVSYNDKEIFQRLKWVMIGVPIALIVSSFALNMTGNGHIFMYFLAYLAMVHFIRQEFGWMKIATRLDPNSPVWLNWLDKTTSYCMTILPITWFIRESSGGFWYRSGDLFKVPDHWANLALNLFWPIVAIFLAANFWHSWKTKTINLSKYLVFVNTFFGWYMAKTQVSNTYLAVWLMIFHHGIPYYFIVFKTERVTQNIGWLQRLGSFKYPALYVGFAAIFYLFLQSHCCNPVVSYLQSQGQAFIYFIAAIATMPQMTHFILDGFIWKRKRGLVTV